MSSVRVRIAPAPSGFLHIGTAKMALFNWLFARNQGGTFILRLEDTDVERTSEEYVQGMCEGLRWLGIDWDEGPAFGDEPEKGEYGPYRQSQRKHLYRQEAMRLLDEGKAYRCFCTKEELDKERDAARLQKRSYIGYSGKCRRLSPREIAARGDVPFAIRFKVPEGETVLEDLVQGTVRVNNREFDDFVILKPTGDPVFHLAVVVDDGLMGITHVIRGDDHLTNAARHLMLFRALGYGVPKFAHLPLVLDEQGRKYSKREHGANVLDWRDDGYLPETLVNYVALLGWTPAEDGREVFTRQELIEAFDLSRLGASAAKFDRKKLDWLNGQHIRKLSAEALRDRLVPFLERAGYDVSQKPPHWLAQLAAIYQERIPTLREIADQADFFFKEPEEYEEKAVRKYWRQDGIGNRMETIRGVVRTVEPFTHDALKAACQAKAEAEGLALGHYVHPMRLALTGRSVGPGLFELAELLGRETCLARIERSIEYIAQLGVEKT